MNERIQSSRNHGFSLIELLAVISIVVVLAVLSAAGLQRARIYAEKSACASNLRQIGMGLITFAADHDGRFPVSGGVIARGSIDPKTGLPGWTEQIEPYVGEAGIAVYRCPSSARIFIGCVKYGYFQGTHPAMEDILAPSGPSFAPVQQMRIASPAITVMGGDIAIDLFGVNDADKDDYTQSPAFPGGTLRIHGGYSNILFYDGHVAAFKAYDNKAMAVQYEGPTDTDLVYK